MTVDSHIQNANYKRYILCDVESVTVCDKYEGPAICFSP